MKKGGFKKYVFRTLSSPIVTLPFLYAYRKKPLVVIYHGITDRESFLGIENYRGKHVGKKTFEADLSYLEKHFSIVPLADIELIIETRTFPKKPVCAITFDDGYKNNYRIAYPILRSRGLPATVFVATDFLDTGKPLWTDRLEYIIDNTKLALLPFHTARGLKTFSLETIEDRKQTDNTLRLFLKQMNSSERRGALDRLAHEAACDLLKAEDGSPDYAPLSWDEAQTLFKNGIEIGAHTVTHPVLGQLSSNDQEKEIALSASRVRSTIGSCRHFAYPNGQPGDWNKETEAILKKTGFKAAWSTLPGRINPLTANPYALARITLDESGFRGRNETLISNLLPSVKKFVE